MQLIRKLLLQSILFHAKLNNNPHTHTHTHTHTHKFGLNAGTYAEWDLIGRDQFGSPTYFIAQMSDARDLYTQPLSQAEVTSNATVSKMRSLVESILLQASESVNGE